MEQISSSPPRFKFPASVLIAWGIYALATLVLVMFDHELVAAYETFELAATLLAALLVPVAGSWAVWRFFRRSRTAALAGFLGLFALFPLGQFLHFRQRMQAFENYKLSRQNAPMFPERDGSKWLTLAELDDQERAKHKETSRLAGYHTADEINVRETVQLFWKRLGEAEDRVIASRQSVPFGKLARLEGMNDVETITACRSTLRQFYNAAIEFYSLQDDDCAALKAELEARGVPASTVNGVLTDVRKILRDDPLHPLKQKKTGIDLEVARAAFALLNFAETHRGEWTFDPVQKKIVFTDEATSAAWENLMERLHLWQDQFDSILAETRDVYRANKAGRL